MWRVTMFASYETIDLGHTSGVPITRLAAVLSLYRLSGAFVTDLPHSFPWMDSLSSSPVARLLFVRPCA